MLTLDAKPHSRLEAGQNGHNRRPCGRYWLAVQTHPQAERWAAANISRAGYHAYLPLILVTRRDRVTPTLLHHVERPLFVGYLFVDLGPTDPWAPIRYAQGVRQVLMNGQKPHHVPAGVVEAVQAGEALRATNPPDSPRLAPGAAVRCFSGPFQGTEAVVISATATTATIALPMLGAIREVSVPVECLLLRV